MLRPKEVAKQLQTAAWSSRQEVELFIQEIPPPSEFTASDVAKLVAVLQDKSLVSDGRHKSRCAAFSMIVERAPDPELFVPLLKALRTADATLRETLVALIPKVNAVSKHTDLCQLLGAPEPEVRRAAGIVLRQVGGQSASDILMELVKDRGFAGRQEALDALMPKAGHHAVPLAQRVVQFGEPHERQHALKYLGDPRLMAKDPQAAIRAIVTALDDNEPRVAAQSLLSLSQLATEEEYFAHLGPRADTTNLARLKAIIDGARRYTSERTVAFLTKKFRGGPNAVRLAVLDATAQIAQDNVLPILLEALSHQRIDVRTRAAEVLAELGTGGKVDVARTIIWLLRSRDTNVRRLAVEVAKKVGDPNGELAPKLLRFLRDEDWWVRERVMDALAEMSGEGLTRHLVAYLKDPSDVVRRFAVGGLVRLKDARAIGAIVNSAMNDTDWWVREQAIVALGELGDKRSIPYLLQVMNTHPTEKLVCIEALSALEAKEAAPKVAECLKDEDPSIRLAAIRCLGVLGDRSTAPLLETLGRDASFAVRTAVNELLTRWNLAGEVGSMSSEGSMNALDRLLAAVAQVGADDLLLASGRHPYVKKLGKITQLSKTVLTDEQVRGILFPHLSAVQLTELEQMHDVDFSYEVKARGLRFRGHIFHQMIGISAVFRIVKNEIPDIDKLGLPSIVRTFGSLKNGLVLIGGPTGSGKSTTLAALIDDINRNSSRHIVTIEDPIEVVHSRNKSLINQREVGTHTPSFVSALRSTLRQDPDVLLVGELRDLPTISFAVSAAETGHLVFGTVHTVSADTSVDRLINAFPGGQQQQVRAMLSDTLRAVCCQHLLRTANGKGRALAVEVMLNNDAVANMIRKGKTFQIPSVIATSRELGMQSMDSELIRLLRAGVVTYEEGYMKAMDKKAFEMAANANKAQPEAGAKPGAVAARPVAQAGPGQPAPGAAQRAPAPVAAPPQDPRRPRV